VISLEAVTFRFDGMAMSFDLQVPEAEITALIGPSGAGKSTLLSLIAGFEFPVSGELRIAGRDMRGIPPERRPVTMIFQDNNVFAHLSLWENVAIGLSPALRLSASERSRTDDALFQVGLGKLGSRLPAEVSGGERQRAAIARALVRDRPVLLLDEPFAALGPALRHEMLDLIKVMQVKRRVTVLMVSHQPEDAVYAASWTAFLAEGRVLAMESTARLLARKDLPELKTYLGS
jgi:thiamine transport system ATP-binding protein